MIADSANLTSQFMLLIAVLDPIDHLSSFRSIASRQPHRQKNMIAIIAIVIAFFVLSAFGLGGQALLRSMGVSLLSLQIAGGVIMLLIAISMVVGAPTGVTVGEEPHVADGDKQPSAIEVAIYPLAVPVIAGPGALLSVVVLMDNGACTWTAHCQVLLILAIVLAILLVTFLWGEPVANLIGPAGSNLLRRVLGMVLAAVAVNLVLNAMAVWLRLPHI